MHQHADAVSFCDSVRGDMGKDDSLAAARRQNEKHAPVACCKGRLNRGYSLFLVFPQAYFHLTPCNHCVFFLALEVIARYPSSVKGKCEEKQRRWRMTPTMDQSGARACPADTGRLSPMHLFDLSDDAYHGDRSRISKSGLDVLHREPWKFKHQILDGHRPEPGPSLIHGKRTHTFVLEPGEVEKRYIKAPSDMPKRPTAAQLKAKKPSDATKEAIERWAEWDACAQGREVITADDWSMYEQAAAAVWDNKYGRALLEQDGWAESTLHFDDEASGVACKSRPDWLLKDGTCIVDLKTTRDAGPAFERSADKFRYHVQAGFYTEAVRRTLGMTPQAFIFLCVELEPPFSVAVYKADDEFVRAGWEEARVDLQVLAACRASGKWPGYGDTVRTLRLPPWKRNKTAAAAPATKEPISTDLVF